MYLKQGQDVYVPEVAVGGVDLGDVAEQLDRVDLRKDLVALQVAQAVQEQLNQGKCTAYCIQEKHLNIISQKFLHMF